MGETLALVEVVIGRLKYLANACGHAESEILFVCMYVLCKFVPHTTVMFSNFDSPKYTLCNK